MKYTFSYKSLGDIERRTQELGVSLPLDGNTEILTTPLKIGSVEIKNRMGIAPMEGFDSNPDGTPSEMARARYLRYARGGAGLIWFESVTVVPEGRSCGLQLALTGKNLPTYQRLIEEIKETALKENGYCPIWSCRPTTAAAIPEIPQACLPPLSPTITRFWKRKTRSTIPV